MRQHPAIALFLSLAAITCLAAEAPAPELTWQEANRRSAALIQEKGPSHEAADLARLAFDSYPRQAKEYSPASHAQLLLNLLHARRASGGVAAARADLDYCVKVLARHAGPKDPVLFEIWNEGARTGIGEGDTYHRNAAEFADATWGPQDARSINAHIDWASHWRAVRGYAWSSTKLRAVRERAAKLDGHPALVAKIDLTLAKLERERGQRDEAIASYLALIGRLEPRSDPAQEHVLEAAYAQLEYLYEEKGDRPAAADMRQRRLQRAGAPELVPLFRVMPRYPRDALRRRVNGWVDMLITQRPDGTVSKVEVIGSEPAGVFDQAAIDAVRQWKFKPRVIDGQAVDSRGRQRLEFRMAD